MAKNEIVMPQMGESITNGTITKWHKKPGEEIKTDEILLEISTDKVESEIPSPFTGRVEELLYNEGETIDVGKTIAIIEDDLSVEFSQKSSKKTNNKKSSDDTPVVSIEKEEAPAKPIKVEKTESSSKTKRFYTPLVKAIAKEANIPLSELEQLAGSGAGGRVNKKDLENYIKNRGVPNIQPTTSLPSTTISGKVEIIKMDNMRKAIAKNMVASKLTSPHVNSIDEIDMTRIVKFREGFKNEFKKQEGINLTYTHFILYALVQALKEHTMVNASVDGDNIILKKDINLGCAVATDGNGLVVPVIKGADGLNITGIARIVNNLAIKAREKKLTMDDLSDGTFTFTNVGSFGTLMATPVILQPQVGIFATGVIKKRPVVVKDDAIAIRSMVYATHTYDHRIIDGQLGGRFLDTVKNNLENMDPNSLF